MEDESESDDPPVVEDESESDDPDAEDERDDPHAEDESYDPCLGPAASNRGGSFEIFSQTGIPQVSLCGYTAKGPNRRSCSVSLATRVPPQNQAVANARPIALITWGSGGATQEAEVDFQNGTAVRLVADWVRVVGTFQAPINVLTWPEFTGSALVLPGNRSGLPPTFSSPRQIVNPATTVIVPVPRWAKNFHLHHTQDASPFVAGMVIEQMAGDVDGERLSIVNGAMIATPATAIPMVNGARALIITDVAGPPGDMGFVVQFELGL